MVERLLGEGATIDGFKSEVCEAAAFILGARCRRKLHAQDRHSWGRRGGWGGYALESSQSRSAPTGLRQAKSVAIHPAAARGAAQTSQCLQL